MYTREGLQMEICLTYDSVLYSGFLNNTRKINKKKEINGNKTQDKNYILQKERAKY